MQLVDSSSIEAAGYDPDDREIYIRFLDGRTYAYGDTDEATFQELLAAESVGGYFNRVIRPGCTCRSV
jgi:hypothetical protein